MRYAMRAARASCAGATWWLAAIRLSLLAGCGDAEPPAFTYYDQRVAPVLAVGCQQQTTGCHVETAIGVASGNLDLTSFDKLMRREDVLPASGPYSVGQLLLKGGDPIQVPVQTFDPPDAAAPDQRFVAITTDVRHAGGRSLREGSDGYALLKSWIVQGHRRDGSVEETFRVSEGACRPGAGSHRGFDPAAPPADDESFRSFVRDVQPVLLDRCAGGTCHGNPVADLYLSCGTSEAEQRWNYFVTLAHVDATPALSELLRRPLAKQRGGTYHEGDTVFASTEERDYVTLRSWIEALVARAPGVVRYQPDDEGLRFFGNYVQPMLVKKGCMFSNCHGPAMFHDLRLRGGSQGVFSRIAIDRNYEMAKLLLSIESRDPNDSRIVAKNLFPPDRGGRGLAHRGGALFEDFVEPASSASCQGIDVATMPLDKVPAYCVFAAWHAVERRLAVTRGEVRADDALSLLYVSRPLGLGDSRDFDTYRPGADLLRAPLTLQGDAPPILGAGTSLLAGCGLSAASTDIRGLAVSWDGRAMAFGARSAQGAPLRLYTASADGSGCAPLPNVAARDAEANGILTHDFDPTYAPDGRIIFASTRGGGDGPSRTLSELAPNADLFVFDPPTRTLRQLTFLSNQELQPGVMADGRLILTTEKRAPDFFQLAGRRQNLDGGDYHPLFAQRASVGFARATEIVELADRNFALVAAPFVTADGAGALAIVNRSIGPDQNDRDPADTLYLHAVSYPARGALFGEPGAFRSPAPLPSRWLVVSCDRAAIDLSRGNFDFDLCALDPRSGQLVTLGGVTGRAEIEAVAVYPRVNHGVFTSRHDEVNGRTEIVPNADDAEVHVLDLPMLSTLLFQNTRTGRPIDARVRGFELLEAEPPPRGVTRFEALPAERVISDAFGRMYLSLRALGKVPANRDGSVKLRTYGGRPLMLRLTDGEGDTLSFPAGAPFTGDMLQREEMQFYPGERSAIGFKRALFDGMCGGCHGSVSGREVDVAVDVDALTSASATEARDRPATSLLR